MLLPLKFPHFPIPDFPFASHFSQRTSQRTNHSGLSHLEAAKQQRWQSTWDASVTLHRLTCSACLQHLLKASHKHLTHDPVAPTVVLGRRTKRWQHFRGAVLSSEGWNGLDTFTPEAAGLLGALCSVSLAESCCERYWDELQSSRRLPWINPNWTESKRPWRKKGSYFSSH